MREVSTISTNGTKSRTLSSTSTMIPLSSPSVRAASVLSMRRDQLVSFVTSYSQLYEHVSSNEACRFHSVSVPTKSDWIESRSRKSKSWVLVSPISHWTSIDKISSPSISGAAILTIESTSIHARVRTRSSFASCMVVVASPVTVVPVLAASPACPLLSKIRW